MARIGDGVECPQCRNAATVVWVSQDGKTVAIKCRGSHHHIERTLVAKKRVRDGMVFLVETADKE